MRRRTSMRFEEVLLGRTGPTLRVGVSQRADGTPDELVIVLGVRSGNRWYEAQASRLELPAAAARELIAAIRRLLGMGGDAEHAGCQHPRSDLVYDGVFGSTMGPDRVHVFRCSHCDNRLAFPAPPAGSADLVALSPDSVTATRPSSPRSPCSTR